MEHRKLSCSMHLIRSHHVWDVKIVKQCWDATPVKCLQQKWNSSYPNILLPFLMHSAHRYKIREMMATTILNSLFFAMCLVSLRCIPKTPIDLRSRGSVWVRPKEVHFMQWNLNHFQFTFFVFVTIALSKTKKNN